SPTVGMVSGSALLIDYVLTITISIASCADAVFSFLPPSWYQYRLLFAIFALTLLSIMNLRGVKESVSVLVPIFLTFVVTHVIVLGYAILSHVANFGEVSSAVVTDIRGAHSEIGYLGMLFVILRAYSMGAGTFTGIEAVSNGMPILREPRVETAKRTMRYMAISLSIVVAGLMLAYLFYSVEHQAGKTLNAVLFEKITTEWGGGSWANIFLLVTLVSEAVLLFAAAQAGFLDGPRILSSMAVDRWFPSKFQILSDRLVTQNGVLLMGGTALITLILTNGSVKFLVVLYSINVFITFVLSQLGMVRHWWMVRAKEILWKKKILINGVGLVLSGFILVTMTVLKFNEGGWITLLITGSLVVVAILIKRHYIKTTKMLKRLNELVISATDISESKNDETDKLPEFNPRAKTAIMLVNGFNGIGLHTLLNSIRLFGGVFKNFIFVQIGVIDAGNFKGAQELTHLETHVTKELDRYVKFIQRHGHFGAAVSAAGTDVVEETLKIAPDLLKKYPGAVFFGGQLVFPEESFLNRWLHNYIVFAIQRKFYHQGIPFVILPIRI
ncbi:MAG: APC family permease, partial [Ignavibacteriae bacterium]|nr:APC family permease [Ignavibacteriota bacterium]